MKYKIGVFGSAVNEGEKIQEKARRLGRELTKQDVILITGVASGLPYEVVWSAAKAGSTIEGFSPCVDLESQKKETPEQDLTIYKKITFVPKDSPFANNINVCRKYRNVNSTANCHAGIIISGRWGTMNEFTNLFDMGKVIGVLTTTGGVADELPRLMKKISKKTNAVVIFSDSPRVLVRKVLGELRK